MNRFLLPWLAALTSLTGCSHGATRPDGAKGPLPVGAPAPEVVGYDLLNNEVRLSGEHGHPVVVYFYPKDGTPGCTKEACAFRDVWKEYQQAHVTVIGVSDNSRADHQAFLSERKLPFALAADERGTVAAAYGVGKGLFGDERVSFLIDAEGKVAHFWPDVDPGVHAKEVLAAAAALPAPPATGAAPARAP